VKTASSPASSPVPLKTPVTDAVKGLKAVGWNPRFSAGSVSVPLAGLNASDARQKYLPGANLEGADLKRANLTGAGLVGAETDRDTVWPEGFDPKAAGVIFE
jgi:hypothetical protein